MTQRFDLVIRHGTIIDGSGSAPIEGDVAVKHGRITAIGSFEGEGAEEIDATGRIVTPGFVDIHTHYDGHATWSQRLNPSSLHGVTTVVMGNCGVGFAPCRADDHDRLIALMEGVEDIPGVVMTTGLTWNWETFPEYLDVLAGGRYDMDIAAQLPHAALRVYVMGDRAVARHPATSDDIAKMAEITTSAIKAGAIGFSTSRSINHKAVDGSVTPSYAAAIEELQGIASAVEAAGAGVLQIISDFDDPEAEFQIIRAMAETGRPLSLSLMQLPPVPDLWSQILGKIERANQDGLQIKGQICGRPVGALIGLELSYNPFSFCPSYREISQLCLAERLQAMRDPGRRARIIGEYPCESFEPISRGLRHPENMFLMSDPPNYEPVAEDSIAAQAVRRGLSPQQYAYELLIEGHGQNIFYIPAANYVNLSIGASQTMLKHPDTILGLGDGGAHCGIICDASLTTHMLARWGKGADPALPLQLVVKQLTSDTAEAVNLRDRGRVSLGYKADLNVIDLENIGLRRPEMVYDLPQGGGRLHQRATGYDVTIVDGIVTYRHGKATGTLPGRLVRGEQATPVCGSARAAG